MKINLRDFFRFYNDDLEAHREAVEWLAENLPDRFLDENAEWVNIYRDKKDVEELLKPIHLPVPFYQQLDNYILPDTTCNSSANAMALEYLKPGSLAPGKTGDDGYLERLLNLGKDYYPHNIGKISPDHNMQTKVLESYGVKSEWRTDLGFLDLDKELREGRPVVIGILHQGPMHNPSRSGGHIVTVIGKTEDGYIVHDPYGSLHDKYTGAVENGNAVVYSKEELENRWTADGLDTGWGRIFAPEKLPASPPEELAEKESPEQPSTSSNDGKDSTSSNRMGWFMRMLTLLLEIFLSPSDGEQPKTKTESPSSSETE